MELAEQESLYTTGKTKVSPVTQNQPVPAWPVHTLNTSGFNWPAKLTHNLIV